MQARLDIRDQMDTFFFLVRKHLLCAAHWGKLPISWPSMAVVVYHASERDFPAANSSSGIQEREEILERWRIRVWEQSVLMNRDLNLLYTLLGGLFSHL